MRAITRFRNNPRPRPAAQSNHGSRPGDFTRLRLRLRPVPGADQAKMDAWLASSPFLAVGIYISATRAPAAPAEPDPDLGLTQLAKGWRLLPDHARPAGELPAGRFPRYGDDDPTINPDPTTGTAPPRASRARPRRSAPSPRHRPRHRAGQHALVRPRGLRPQQHQLPRVGARVPHGLDHPAPRARLRLGRLLQRRLGHQDPRRRPGEPARPPSSCPTRSGSRAGTAWPTPRPPTSATTAGSRTPGQAVPGRAQRDLGRRDDQHRPQLPRPRPRLLVRRTETHCDGVAPAGASAAPAAPRSGACSVRSSPAGSPCR
jgi:hypothetical protein